MSDRNNSMVSSAMNYALFLGLFWIFKYIFVIFGDNSDRSLYIASILNIFTPVLYYILLCRYRDVDRKGKVNYGDTILFSLLLFLFASLIELVIVCLHIFIINPGALSLYSQQIQEATKYMNAGTAEQKQAFENVMNFYMSNIKVIFIVSRILVNFLLGLFLSLILGYFVSKRKTNHNQNS